MVLEKLHKQRHRSSRRWSYVSMDSTLAPSIAPFHEAATVSGSSTTIQASHDVDHRSSHSLEADISMQDLGKDVERADDDPPPTPPQKSPPTTEKAEKNPDLVEFDGPDDPGNPKNWPKPRRWRITASMGMMTFVVTFASSIFSVAIDSVSKEYHVGTVVATLGVSLFLLVSQ